MKTERNDSSDLNDLLVELTESTDSSSNSRGWNWEAKELFSVLKAHYKQSIHIYNITKTSTMSSTNGSKPPLFIGTTTKAPTGATGSDWGIYVAAVVSIGVTVVILFSIFLICRDVFKRRKGRQTEDLERDVMPPSYEEVQTHPQTYEQISHISRNISSISIVTTGSLPPPDYDNLFGFELHSKLQRPKMGPTCPVDQVLNPLPILRKVLEGTTDSPESHEETGSKSNRKIVLRRSTSDTRRKVALSTGVNRKSSLP